MHNPFRLLPSSDGQPRQVHWTPVSSTRPSPMRILLGFVTGLALYLVSPEARWMTGTTRYINGGIVSPINWYKIKAVLRRMRRSADAKS